MFPLAMRLKVRPRERRGASLWFPVVLVWIILWAVMIALLPLVVLAALLTWRNGPGPRLLLVYPLLFSVLWHLSGLHIETRNAEKELLISFD